MNHSITVNEQSFSDIWSNKKTFLHWMYDMDINDEILISEPNSKKEILATVTYREATEYDSYILGIRVHSKGFQKTEPSVYKKLVVKNVKV